MTMTDDELRTLAIRFRETLDEVERDHEIAEQEEWERTYIGQITEAITAKQDELDEVEAKVAEAHRVLESFPWLWDVLDFVNGTITHMAFPDGPEMVLPVDDAMEQKDRHDRRPRLLTITPRKHRRRDVPPFWEVNTYSDGSGRDRRVIPCRSVEAAHQQVVAWFEADLAVFRSWVASGHAGPAYKNMGNRHEWGKYLRSGVDLPWPADLIDHLRHEDSAEAAKKVADARAKLDKALADSSDRSDLPEPVEGGR